MYVSRIKFEISSSESAVSLGNFDGHSGYLKMDKTTWKRVNIFNRWNVMNGPKAESSHYRDLRQFLSFRTPGKEIDEMQDK
ncbi:hypothetical protein TNCT_139191 [Trichonephila clavata]|uniref:Uncharacterized protein n=1 Tax=Trichonephila clavata TaxID=2740835 RepID=A0A8X6H5L6_TRICU|nr:hypothetical protein TNCT_139191 [Trichonephila clavata]